MSSYLTEAEVLTRRDLAAHETERRTHGHAPVHPAPRRRTRVAAGLRRVADRLEH